MYSCQPVSKMACLSQCCGVWMAVSENDSPYECSPYATVTAGRLLSVAHCQSCATKTHISILLSGGIGKAWNHGQV